MANTKITSRVIADNSVGIDALNVTDGTNGQALVTDGSGTLSFSTIQGYTDSDVETYLNTSEIYTDATNDRLGIGTTLPEKILHIKTSVNNTAFARIESTATNSYPTLSLKNDAREYQLTTHGGVSDSFVIYDGTAAANRLVIDSSGRVGIGTSSPSTYGKLVVVDGTLASINSGGNQQLITVANSTITANLGVFNPNIPNTASLTTVGAHPLAFGTSNTERMRIDSAGKIGMPAIGQTSSWMGGEAKLGINSTSAPDASLSIHRHYNGAFSGYLVFQKSRSTDITNLGVVSSGDYLGSIEFTGSDGNSYSQGAHIRAIVDGTPGDQDMPTKLTFSTTPDGSATPLDRLTIGASGQITLNSHVVSDRSDFFDTGLIAASGTYTSPSTQDAPGGLITITLASDPFDPSNPANGGEQLINTYHHIPGRTGAYEAVTTTIASTNRGTPHGTIAFAGGVYTITNTSGSYPLYYKIRHMTG